MFTYLVNVLDYLGARAEHDRAIGPIPLLLLISGLERALHQARDLWSFFKIMFVYLVYFGFIWFLTIFYERWAIRLLCLAYYYYSDISVTGTVGNCRVCEGNLSGAEGCCVWGSHGRAGSGVLPWVGKSGIVDDGFTTLQFRETAAVMGYSRTFNRG